MPAKAIRTAGKQKVLPTKASRTATTTVGPKGKKDKSAKSKKKKSTSTLVTAPRSLESSGPNDVVCGRGCGHYVKSEGNVAFRQLVEANFDRYEAAEKNRKIDISKEIVAIIRARRGKFLFHCTETETWRDMDDRRAIEKTSQTFRDLRTKPIVSVLKNVSTPATYELHVPNPNVLNKTPVPNPTVANKTPASSLTTRTPTTTFCASSSSRKTKRTKTMKAKKCAQLELKAAPTKRRVGTIAKKHKPSSSRNEIRAQKAEEDTTKSKGALEKGSISSPKGRRLALPRTTSRQTVDHEKLTSTGTNKTSFLLHHDDENTATVPQDIDVIFGRGSNAPDHWGNIAFLTVIHMNQDKYFHSSVPQGDKLVEDIVKELYTEGVRFLELDTSTNEATWVELSFRRALTRTANAFSVARSQTAPDHPGAPSWSYGFHRICSLLSDCGSHGQQCSNNDGAKVTDILVDSNDVESTLNNKNPGNHAFTFIIQQLQLRYGVLSRSEKLSMSETVVAHIQSEGGRFLGKSRDGSFTELRPVAAVAYAATSLRGTKAGTLVTSHVLPGKLTFSQLCAHHKQHLSGLHRSSLSPSRGLQTLIAPSSSDTENGGCDSRGGNMLEDPLPPLPPPALERYPSQCRLKATTSGDYSLDDLDEYASTVAPPPPDFVYTQSLAAIWHENNELQPRFIALAGLSTDGMIRDGFKRDENVSLMSPTEGIKLPWLQ